MDQKSVLIKNRFSKLLNRLIQIEPLEKDQLVRLITRIKVEQVPKVLKVPEVIRLIQKNLKEHQDLVHQLLEEAKKMDLINSILKES